MNGTENNCYISKNAQIHESVKIGKNVQIKDNVVIQENAIIGDGCYIGENSFIGKEVYLDLQVIIRDNTRIEKNTFIGARCIIGEYLMDFIKNRNKQYVSTTIGENSIIRSETIIYGDNSFGKELQTGHRVTIRERSRIGHNVRIGTLSDIQGECWIGNYVSMHSSVHVGQNSIIKDYAWIYPYVVLTNDPNPPSDQITGVTVEEFAVVATGSIVLPDINIGKDALVGAGTLVNKNVAEGKVVVGNPVRELCNIDKVKMKSTGEPAYPWRNHFDRGMPWKELGYDKWSEQM